MMALLAEIADRPILGEAATPTAPTLEQVLSGLRRHGRRVSRMRKKWHFGARYGV